MKIFMYRTSGGKDLLKKINEEKNVLFTKESIKLRKKNGFWLPKEE